jgi:hypothetical protein
VHANGFAPIGASAGEAAGGAGGGGSGGTSAPMPIPGLPPGVGTQVTPHAVLLPPGMTVPPMPGAGSAVGGVPVIAGWPAGAPAGPGVTSAGLPFGSSTPAALAASHATAAMARGAAGWGGGVGADGGAAAPAMAAMVPAPPAGGAGAAAAAASAVARTVAAMTTQQVEEMEKRRLRYEARLADYMNQQRMTWQELMASQHAAQVSLMQQILSAGANTVKFITPVPPAVPQPLEVIEGKPVFRLTDVPVLRMPNGAEQAHHMAFGMLLRLPDGATIMPCAINQKSPVKPSWHSPDQRSNRHAFIALATAKMVAYNTAMAERKPAEVARAAADAITSAVATSEGMSGAIIPMERGMYYGARDLSEYQRADTIMVRCTGRGGGGWLCKRAHRAHPLHSARVHPTITQSRMLALEPFRTLAEYISTTQTSLEQVGRGRLAPDRHPSCDVNRALPPPPSPRRPPARRW